MGDLHPEFQLKLSQAIDKMAGHYMTALSEAADRGDIPADLDIRETAYFIVSSWHGALMRMKVEKNLEPLEIWSRFIFNRILQVQ